MVWSSLAPKWLILAPFVWINHQKSKFSMISYTLSVRGCWGQPMLLFWKLVDDTQILTTLEAISHHSSRILDWILAPFLSEAIEASPCYFFENQECTSKIYHLRIPEPLSNKILLTYFNLSEPIHKIQFNVRYPVGGSNAPIQHKIGPLEPPYTN